MSIRKKFGVLVWVLCLLGFQEGKAQALPLWFVVADEVDLVPIEGAKAEIDFGPITTIVTSDDRGRVSLREGSFENAEVTLSHPDYFTQTLKFSEIQSLGFKVFMESRSAEMEGVVLSASKRAEKRDNVPNRIEVIKAKEIAFQNPATSADLLIQNGGVFVQKSQMGGGSPNLRGFEANKVLIVVDGVRLNNAIFRGGHLQNVVTLDPNMVERTEVVFGPASVVYGSDALGGVMHFFSKTPALSSDGKLNFKLKAFTRYASANGERTGHIDANFGWKKFGMMSSFTASDFLDLKSGKVHPKDYPDFGKREFYATRLAGRDTMLPNENVHLQRFSGYTQYDFMQKFYYLPNDKSSHSLNVQYSTSSDVPRYDRLSEFNGTNLKYHNWYYGPQKRLFVAYNGVLYGDSTFFDKAKLVLAYQNLEESRHNRRFQRDWQTHRTENVGVYTANLNFSKSMGTSHDLDYGVEYNYNSVGSSAFQENIVTGVIDALDTRYPDGGSTMQMAAAYVEHEWEVSENFRLSDGVRYTWVGLQSRFENKTFFPFLADQISQSSGALSGTLGAVWKPGSGFRIAALLATGFRAPNVDDLGKVFDSSPGNVIVPNPNVSPEYTYNGELTLGKRFGGWLRLEATGWYTWFDNALVVRDFSISGEDSIMYDGVLSKVQATQNAGSAYIYGFNFNASADIGRHVTMTQTFTYTRGQDRSIDVPLSHIPPMFGKTSVRFRMPKFQAEIYSLYNGRKDISRYNPSGEDNQKFAPADGVYGWWTLNLKTAWAIHPNLKLQIGLENILDRHYRHFASGISAPGRNFIAAIRAEF